MCSLFAGEFKPSEGHCKLLEEEKQVAQKSNRNLQYKGALEGKQYGPWMKLEPIIQSEVSQKEKHQYSILTHIYGI